MFKRTLVIILAIVVFAVFPCGCAKEEPSEYEFTCTVTVECLSIFDHMDELDPDKLEVLPENGYIIERTEVGFNEGESVYDVLRRITRERGINMEASYTPVYDSSYIEGINNIYEFDCGPMSGWTYSVNGTYPQYGCSGYKLQDGDDIIWHYTCEYMTELDWSDTAD